MFKRTAATVPILAGLTAMLTVVACGKKLNEPGDKPVAVVPPPPTLVSNTPQVSGAAIGAVLQIVPTVTLRDHNGSGIPDVWVKWTASSGRVAADSSKTDVSGRADSGPWTLGTVSGLQTVTAKASGLSVVAMGAIVAPGPLASFVTVPANITGVVGSNVTTPASIKAVDVYGNGVPDVFVQFSLWDGDGSISGAGQTTNENGIASVGSWKLGPKAGPQAVRADDSRTGANTIVHAVALPAPASQFAVIDGNAQAGQANKRLCTSPVISVRDAFGNGVGQIPVVFTPGAGSGAVTDGSVVSSAVSGYATVGAWTLSGSDAQTLIVTSPVLPGVSLTLTATVAPSAVYSVCVRFVGDVGTPRQRQAVTTAVERWQRVIVGHVQTSPLNESANRCFFGEPAIDETVEDLLVFVQITTLDGFGNAVARAGPCTVHMPATLTQMGVLQLDSADVDLLLAQGTLDNIVTHELGHILGFGTHWYAHGLLTGAGTDDPFFTGASARTQFASIFPSYAGNAVPVENTGDIGTRDTHWRRNVFGDELMQGVSSATMPMSRVTVGSLGDLGYIVDVNKADPFTTTTAARASSTSSSELANDIAGFEIFGVDKNGRRVLMRAPRNPFVRK